MSSGAGIPYAEAYKIGGFVMDALRSVAVDIYERDALNLLEPVGSMRRMKPVVGDLEVLAPLPQAFEEIETLERTGEKLPPPSERPGWDEDPLFRVLNRIVDNPPNKPAKVAGVLWLQPTEPEKPEPARVLGSAEQGLRPGFKSCRIVLRAKVGEIKLEVFRAARDAYGWKKLMATGPDDFGIHFLWKWKLRYGIPVGDESAGGQKASVDGYLVDGGRKIVSVPTEEDAFKLCGMEFIPPERREWFMSHLRG